MVNNQPTTTLWAYIRADGRVVADSDFRDADQARNIVLGWPHPDEVDAAIARGERATQLVVSEPIDDTDAANAICQAFIATEGIEPDDEYDWYRFVMALNDAGFVITKRIQNARKDLDNG